jgi:hypothetical protein
MIWFALTISVAAFAAFAVIVISIQVCERRQSLFDRSHDGRAGTFARKVLALHAQQPATSARRQHKAELAESGPEVNVDIHSLLIAMRRQSEMNMNSASAGPATIPDSGLSAELSDEHSAVVLSAAMLQAVMNTYGEDDRGFALRAGVTEEVVAGVASGTNPAWELLHTEFTAMADAVSALWPGAAFETAAACDLLLSSVLNGELTMATDVLTEPDSRDLARTLLRLAVTSRPLGRVGESGCCLLADDVLSLLRRGCGHSSRWVTTPRGSRGRWKSLLT